MGGRSSICPICQHLQVYLQVGRKHLGFPQLVPSRDRSDGTTCRDILLQASFPYDARNHVQELSCGSHAVQQSVAADPEDHAPDPKHSTKGRLQAISGFRVEASSLGLLTEAGQMVPG